MNFQRSQEHEMLRASLAAAFARDAGGRDAAALADLGISGMLVAEDHGGLGLGMAEAAVVLEEAGRAGRGGSLAETLLLADAIAAEGPESRARVLAGAAPVVAPVSGTLRRAGGRLSGTVSIARPRPDALLAVALDDGADVALLPASRFEPLARARLEAEADACAMDIEVPLGEARLVRVDAFADRLAILRCAELLGAADRCFRLAVAYMKDRTQFGQPIGANQALKHIAADSYLALENLRVAVEYAAAASDLAARGDARAAGAAHAVAVMLAYVPATAREIAETAIHLHGGIGLTWEYPLNAHMRRIVRLGTALGSVSGRRLALFDHFQREDAADGAGPAMAGLQQDGVLHDSAL